MEEIVLGTESYYFVHPFTCIIAGPTGCGKTYFVKQLLQSNLIDPQPQQILYCYGQYQPMFDAIEQQWSKSDVAIRFHQGIPDDIEQMLSKSTNVPKLLLLDDLMQDASSNPRITKLFVQGSHHLNLSVIFIVQNFFQKGSEMRTISLNCHYLVLFKNPRDRSQISALGRQMYPRNGKALSDAFIDATSQPYGYLVINLRPTTHEKCRLYTKIFDSAVTVYVLRNL